MMPTRTCSDGLPHLLLVEPNSLIRSTVSAVCQQIALVEVHQAASVAAAEQVLQSHPIDLMLISLNQVEEAFALLALIRGGWWGVTAEMPIAVTVQNANSEMIARIRPMEVSRVLLQPYKIRDVIETVEILCQELQQSA